MGELVSGVPSLYWVAFAFLGLALWSHDLFGIYLGVACMVVGTLQVLRRGKQQGDPDGGRGG